MADGRDQDSYRPPAAGRTNEPSGETGFEREPSNAFNVVSTSLSSLVDDEDLAEEDRTFDAPLVIDETALQSGAQEPRDGEGSPALPMLKRYSAPRLAVQTEHGQPTPDKNSNAEEPDTLPGPRLDPSRANGPAATTTPRMWDDAVTRASVAILAFILFFAGVG
ncbi:MAG: hypothetical protein ACJA1R_002866, partial [Flavobacteriales bacterium]